MADKSFGVKELNLLNASGTPTVTSPNNLNLNANTVAISTSATVGNNLTVTSTTNSANLNVTGIGTLTRAFATDLSVSGVTTITVPANANPHSSWDVVNNSASAYRFTGPGQDGAEDNPNIYLVRGQRYVFKMNASGHPFQIRVANGGAAYSDGVTNNGAQTGNVVFNVQHDAPAQLYYQCTSHGGMVGNIYIVGGPQVISGVVTATTFVGNLTGNVTGTASANAVLTGSTNNTLVTVTGANAITGESSLTYDGTVLNISNDIPQLYLTDTNSNNSYGRVRGNGGNLVLSADTNNATGGSVIVLEVDNSEKARIDNYGTLRIGNIVTTESTSSNTKRIALGAKASIWGWVSGQINGALTLADNYYWDGSNNKAIENDYSAYLTLRSGNLRFGTTNQTHSAGGNITGGIHEKFRIETNGNATINDGNLVIGTSGHGIDFHNYGSGTNISSNLLDDYEEGSAVPDFANADNSIVTVNRYTYTKVGRLVHFEAKFTVGSNNDGSGFGFTLPVAQGGSRETVIPAISTRSGTTTTPFAFVVNANQSYAYAKALDGYSATNCEYLDFAGDIILVSGTYEST